MTLRTIMISAMLATLSGAAGAQEALAPREPHRIEQICGEDGCQWEKVATCEGFIEGINFDAEGRMFIVGLLTGSIYEVADGGCTPVGESQGSPNGARIAPNGDLLVADRFEGLISVDLDSGERTSLHRGDGVAMFRGLNDLAFDPEGGLYFTEPYGSDALNPTGRVFFLSAEEGAVPEVFASGIAYPNGVAVSPDGARVYVAEFAANRILSIPGPLSRNPADVPHVFAQLVGGLGPDGLLVDDAGNLYAAQFFAGQIAVMDAFAMPYGVIRLPEGAGQGTTNLALHDGYLYVTEAFANEVWRVALNGDAVTLPGSD